MAGEWLAGRIAWRRIATACVAAGRGGGGRPVLVLPGFLADDHLTITLRRTLAAAGWRPHGWAQGPNRGISPALLAAMLDRLDRVAGADGPVALLGWSLGGLYARELAKRRPTRVERVVTLGSPFSGDLHWTRVWRLYERIAGHPVDAPPVPIALAQKPPVPTIALWSARDGVVAPEAARGLRHESDVQIHVPTSHLGLVCAPAALRAALDALSIPVTAMQEGRLNEAELPRIGAPLGSAGPPFPGA